MRNTRGRPWSRVRLTAFGTLLLVAAGLAAASAAGEGGAASGWPTHGGDPGGSHYTPLADITPENVAGLTIAWEYHTGDWPAGNPSLRKIAFQATPILDGGTLYLCTPADRIIALDAETGAERWVFDPRADLSDLEWSATCRGVALWRASTDGTAPCTRRVFLGTMDARLLAVDARTGAACSDFGRSGAVDLSQGLGDLRPFEYYVTSPPTVVGDVVVVGALVADNRRADGPGGVVRAYDVRSGALRWYFDPAPPGVPPLPPAPDGSPRFHRGTPNAWSIASVDVARELVFVPFGGPSPDFYGGQRKGFDYYGSSVVALAAGTGEVVWHFQTVHHDLWDYDVASQPVLIDVEKDGRSVPAVAQATKMGHLFLLHRETGAPIYPVEERPVPQTDVPGEYTSPTQPFPTFPKPLHPHHLELDAVFAITPLDRALCRRRIRSLRYEGIFTPPSLRGSLQYPGTAGGQNWGSIAWDPERKLLIAPQSRLAQVQTLIPRASLSDPAAAAGALPRPKDLSWQEGTPYLVRHDVLLSPFGIPCSPLPWGSLLAVDLATGEKRWEVPFGTTRDLLPIPLPMPFGLPSMGGPLATATGLVFIGASMDDYIRAFDSESGEELWRFRLPAGGQATPLSYRVRAGGKQYVVIAAGGHSTLRTTLGDSLIAFALP